MAGYLQRLARQTGLLTAAPRHAPAAHADIVEVHEEHVIATDERASANESPAFTAPVSDAAATPIVRSESSPAVSAEPAALAADDVTGAQPVPPQTGVLPPIAERTERPRPDDALTAAGARAPSARSLAATPADASPTRPASEAAGMDGPLPSAPRTFTPSVSATAAEASSPATAPTQAFAMRPAPAATRPTAHAGAATQGAQHEVAVAHAVSSRLTSPPPRTQVIATAAAPPSVRVPEASRDSGPRVHIGHISIEIHAPPQKPPVPGYAAPAMQPVAREPADAPFSASRHYLRA